MAKKPIPTPEELRQLLTYDPETGKLFWKERTPEMFGAGNQTPERNCSSWNKKYANKEAFTASSLGYHVGAVYRHKMYAHQVAWALYHGEWPDKEIDHINRIKSDNRIANLRLATRAQNKQNLGLYRNNTSGHQGVTWCKDKLKWQASIKCRGRGYYLGRYEEIADAVAAHTSAKRRLHEYSTLGGQNEVP